MTQRVYIGSTEGHTGKSTVAVAVLAALRGRYRSVGVFKPVIHTLDHDDSAAIGPVLQGLAKPVNDLSRGGACATS